MVVKSNPASRLLAIVQAAKESSPNHSAAAAWSEALQCGPEVRHVMKGLTDLLALCDETRDSIELHISNTALFLAPIERVEQVISIGNLSMGWSHSRDMLDSPTLLGLQFCEVTLSANYPEAGSVDEEQIQLFIKKLEELIHECLASELPKDLIKVLIRHLESLRSALVNFRVNGADGLRSSINEFVGSLVRNQGSVKEHASENGSIFPKLFDTLGRLNDIVSACQTVAPVAIPLATMLLGLAK
jgi:hypothetical protein